MIVFGSKKINIQWYQVWLRGCFDIFFLLCLKFRSIFPFIVNMNFKVAMNCSGEKNKYFPNKNRSYEKIVISFFSSMYWFSAICSHTHRIPFAIGVKQLSAKKALVERARFFSSHICLYLCNDLRFGLAHCSFCAFFIQWTASGKENRLGARFYFFSFWMHCSNRTNASIHVEIMVWLGGFNAPAMQFI